MCGINGFSWEDKNLIEKMNTKIAHRGPDDGGVFLSPGISLGHRRLSIIDLSQAAHQPMLSRDSRYAIVYNGELYNFKEIKAELGEYNFISESDTEVVLCAYIKWGRECVKKFNGIFSFAIWDKEKKELFLARDQFGIKPLYFYFKDGKFIFSSEVKAILEHQIRRELNLGAFNNYFRFLYVLGPETMWKDIKKLLPGHFAYFKSGNLEIEKYYVLPAGKFSGSYEEGKALARQRMNCAVRRQLISDRPVGLFLSGGLDSSIICAEMAELIGNGNLRTFSVGFETAIAPEKFNADFNIAAKTAAHFGAIHTPVLIKDSDVAEFFEKCVLHMDEPVSNHIQVATYLLARKTKDSVAVVLGGDGGDETFGGYDRYYYMHILGEFRKYFPFLKNKSVKTALGKILKDSVLEKLCAQTDFGMFLSFMSQKEVLIASFIKPEYNNSQVKNIYSEHFSGDLDLAERAMRADVATWLVDESLIRSDKLTMAHGLEQRVPFLDKDLAEFSFSLPMSFKLKNKMQGKKILREAYSEVIPDFVLSEQKRGFFSPAAKWLRGPILQSMAREILSPGYTEKTKELFDWNEIKIILDNHIEFKQYALNTIWSLMTFQVWAKNYL